MGVRGVYDLTAFLSGWDQFETGVSYCLCKKNDGRTVGRGVGLSLLYRVYMIREKERARERSREREKERVCMYVCVSV